MCSRCDRRRICVQSKEVRYFPPNSEISQFFVTFSLLIHGAAVQIAYHALLHQSGSTSLERLAQLDLNPAQIMLIVAAQDFIEEELYYNYAYNSTDINEM